MSVEAILIAMITAMPGLIALVGQLRKDKSQAVNLDAQAEQLRDEITKSVLATARQEIDRHTARITALESELARAQELIGQLQTMVRERDQAIANLQFSLTERDKVIVNLQSQINSLRGQTSSGGLMKR